ncbi:hypothetical protein [Gilliamella sp. Bif1-4]|uniref:hypothetical protein n=1 Tax=Gilliamella sp. Bif1-4 TaxID=3120233 RepID=UPI00080E2B64|nr:hypothetical protein [Gilliamella apicola]OCG41786.1 hypothetical protein A9G25_03325 [Gilliamella apicola]
MSSSSNLQALNGKKARAGNRSDAIVIPSPVIDYVRPNLFSGDDKFAGPVDIWNPDKGFLVQSINPESYNLNFPTTGAHNLYFDLLISEVDINELKWEPVTHEGITATVTNVVPNDYWIPWEDFAKVVARVKLTGPEARTQRNNPKPSQIAKPELPQTFELVGRDRYGIEVVKYGFVLRQWFVNRGGQYEPYSDQLAWCNSLGYRMPRVRDLTNAKCGVNFNFPCINGVDGATPSSVHREYQRQIGAGFFTEWGYMHYYRDAGFVPYNYWTSDAVGSFQFDVYSYSGLVGNAFVSSSRYGLCTAP